MKYILDKIESSKKRKKDILDSSFLKHFIVPLDKKIFKNRNKKNKKVLTTAKFPEEYYKDVKYICSKYDCNFKLRVVEKPEDSYDFYKRENKTIYLSFKKGDFATSYDIYKHFSHELAHRIQHIYEDSVGGLSISTISKVLKYERCAERLAYFIYKEYFKNLGGLNLHHLNFCSYRSISDKKWLAKYYNGWYVDDIGVLKK